MKDQQKTLYKANVNEFKFSTNFFLLMSKEFIDKPKIFTN